MGNKIKLAILWHMHQPDYRSPVVSDFTLPWVRLHGIKDYYGMVHLLGQFPGIKMTFNLVPSLLVQLQQYLAGGEDIYQKIFTKPADSLFPDEVGFLVTHFFKANRDHLIRRHPGYEALYRKKMNYLGRNGDPDWRNVFSAEELRDIQVWFPLSHFDEEYQENDGEIRSLLRQGGKFSEPDKRIIVRKEKELLGKIIPEYRRFSESGQIEISTSPFYHPILPLLIDPQMGRISNPHLPEYPLAFHWREDAVGQLEKARQYVENLFGGKIAGVWPSEGSLSSAVLEILEQMGFLWTAADETNLSRTLSRSIERDAQMNVRNPELLYRPYRMENSSLRIFFRDHHLSDLIGFYYQKFDAAEAAADLHRRLKALQDERRGERTVSIILDGENAWEFYPHNGRDFLKQFYALLSRDKTIETVTFAEAAATEPEVLSTYCPGSWINGNFDIWIGDEEDRKGWELLKEAHNAMEMEKSKLPPEKLPLIRDRLFIAEGSDWFWWFGRQNFTSDLEVFDSLFRQNLQEVYRLLGLPVPEKLKIPVCDLDRIREIRVLEPGDYVGPVIDGEITDFFEWEDAGEIILEISGSAMNMSQSIVQAIRYGFNRQDLFLRIDTRKEAEAYFATGFSLTIAIQEDGRKSTITLPGGAKTTAFAVQVADPLDVGLGKIIELRISLKSLGLAEGESFSIRFEWFAAGQLFQSIPVRAPIRLRVPTGHDYSANWQV